MGSMTVRNQTKYSIDHLQRLADMCLEATTNKECTVTFSYRQFDVDDGGPWCRQSKSDSYKAERRNRRQLWQAEPEFNLYVPNPNFWFKLSGSMGALADGLQAGKDLAPLQFTEDVVKGLRILNDFFVGHHYSRSHSPSYTLKPVPVGLERIPMTDALPKTNVRKLTHEESINRLKEEYGLGRIMTGSSSTYAGQWDLTDVEGYYAREFERRDAWRVKVQEKGGVIPASQLHETFPQYLRRMADEIESRGGSYGYRRNLIDWKKFPKWEKE